MNDFFLLNDFIYDKTNNLFMFPKDFKHDYSDGTEMELKIFNIINLAQDKGTSSTFLKENIKDWPTEYHFSELRHNLLRHYDLKKKSILELGAGCGGITRYLCENSKNVDAIEGSYNRAKCAGKRCSDLDNVRVFCGDFTKIKISNRYDVVTLIGVAEYAPIYHKSADPFTDYLKIAKNFLKDDGYLILAIENKLGLKYFAGLPEDHNGIPYFGISNLYYDNTVITFSKKEIIHKLNKAGFRFNDFSYPFPDYKLPKVIINNSALLEEEFRVCDILLSLKDRDYSNKYKPTFNTGLAWESIENSQLIDQLANSFLIKASIANLPKEKNDNLVYYYTLDRKPKYNTTTKFYKKNKKIRVEKSPIYNLIEEKDSACFLHQVLNDTKYIKGILLEREILKNIQKNDTNGVILCLRQWIHFLLNNAIKIKKSNIFLSIIKSEYFDCLPFNLIKTENGLIYIDLEWKINIDITIYQIILRYLITIESKYSILFSNNLKYNDMDIISLLDNLDLPIILKEIERFEKLHANVSLEVNNLDTKRKVLKKKYQRLFNKILVCVSTWINKKTKEDS